MSDTKHTPGPWEDNSAAPLRIGDCLFGHQIWTGKGRIALTEQQIVGAEEEAANAHLIAAAPDMYEALEALRAESTPDNSVAEAAYEQACAALAKARGTST